MRPFLSLLAAVCVVAAFSSAVAQTAPASTPIPSAAAPTSVPAVVQSTQPPATAPKPAPMPLVEVPKPLTAELRDGTVVEFDQDGSVFILNSDNTKIPAPDGIMTLRDKTTFTVKGGKKEDE